MKTSADIRVRAAERVLQSALDDLRAWNRIYGISDFERGRRKSAARSNIRAAAAALSSARIAARDEYLAALVYAR